MATDIIARGMAGAAKKGGVVTKEKVVGALGYTPTYADDESNGSSESTYSSEKIIKKISEVESWTGTKAEWEALDKSTLVNGQQINITDDEETIDSYTKEQIDKRFLTIDKDIDGINESLNGKVNTETGKGLSTNDLTNELKSSYDNAVSNSHTHANKTVLNNITSTNVENWNEAYLKAHAHTNKTVLDKLNTDSENNLTYDNKVVMDLDKFFALQRTGKVYGVKVYKSSANPTSVCEKTRDNAGLVHEPSTDTIEGRDDYENIPLFKWYEVNYKRYDDGFAYPTAYQGDSNFQTENVDIGAMQMTFYYNWIDSSDEYRELVISDTPNEELGLRPFELAVRADGTVMPYFIQSRFVSVLGTDGLLHSMHGKVARAQSYDNMIVNYQKKGKGYWGAGSSKFTFGQIFNLIKNANKSSQKTFVGVTNWNIQYPAAVQSAEKHNYFPVTNAQAANMQVGLCVSVGYADTTNSLDRGYNNIHAYADDVKITAIEPLDDNNMAVYLDCAPFDTMPIVTDDLTRQIYISSMCAHSGDTDSVIGHHDGSPLSNADGKHSYRIQGVEYSVGAQEVASDTVMFFNDDYSKDVYVAPRGVAPVSNDTVIKNTFTKIGTIAAKSNGSGGDYWTGDVTHNNGGWLPYGEVASAAVGNGDTLYAGGTSTSGSREYRQGGNLGSGSYAGLCYLYCWSLRSRALWNTCTAD